MVSIVCQSYSLADFLNGNIDDPHAVVGQEGVVGDHAPGTHLEGVWKLFVLEPSPYILAGESESTGRLEKVQLTKNFGWSHDILAARKD